MPLPDKVFGYKVRVPYMTESLYFKNNPNVAGMAAEDGAITLNPFSPLNDDQKLSVAKNEAARLYIKEQKLDLDFDITNEQQKLFAGTEYGKPENLQNLKATIAARGLSGDTSSGELTKHQLEWIESIKQGLNKREAK